MRSEVQVLLDPPLASLLADRGGEFLACASSVLRATRAATHPHLAPRRGSGALAQLVERLLCKQDVIGSNPLGSTIFLRHDQTAPWVLSRPVGRRLLRKPFNIVQRDNQRCRPHPSGGVVAIFGSPTATLSKSSTLTKCVCPAWDRRTCPFRMEGAGNVHAFDRKRPSRAAKGRGAEG